MSGIRQHLTYANVGVTIALVLSIGTGGAIAASALIGSDDIERNAVLSKHVDNNQLKSKDIKDSKGVKSIDIADGTVGAADIADGGVGAAEIADAGVGTAEIQDGVVGSADLTNLEAPHLVGAPGEPAFGTGGDGDCLWRNLNPAIELGSSGLNPVSFYKDPLGIVHLEGFILSDAGPGGDGACNGADAFTDGIAFTLPPAYQPQTGAQYPSIAASGVAIAGITPLVAGTTTFPSGAVFIPAGTAGASGGADSLDGISFRAADASTTRAQAKSGAVTDSGEEPADLSDLPGALFGG